MSETVFLVNPASAAGSTGRRWPELAHAAAVAGLAGETRFSTAPGHLTELAGEAIAGGARLLVVVGGDGSVNEVANAAVGHDVELGIVPRGTGWDFARSQGIPKRTEAALRAIGQGHARAIDAGRVTYRSWSGDDETRYFVNVASAGMSGAIAQRTNETSKALGGKVSYFWATLAVFSGWRVDEMTVAVDGERRSGRMHDVVVANGPYFGGGMRICPDARADDGLFDVLLIGDLTKLDLALNLPKTYRGRHLPHPKAELLRGRTVELEASAPTPVELDGEQPGTTPARFELVPAALRVRVPNS